MLELAETGAGVVRALAGAKALERFPLVPGAIRCRVASDELLLFLPAGPSAEVVAAAAAYLEKADPSGLVADEGGGYTVWTLSGQDATEAFARLSAVPPAGGFLQGRIAGVPAKAVVLDDRIHILVAASHGAYVEERILSACRDLLPPPEEPSDLLPPPEGAEEQT